MAAENPWRSARYHQEIVPIADGARQISVIIAGQKRLNSEQPLVIIEPGLGGVAAEHVVVAQLIHSFARVLRYERAGYGASTFSQQPDTITAAERARDLSLVLEAIDLPPPYIVVGQSYGGTIIREFLQQRGSKDVVGMVLVDCIPLIQGLGRIEKIVGVLCGDKYSEVVGLAQNRILTPEQLIELENASSIAMVNGTVEAEAKVAVESQSTLNGSQGAEITRNNDGVATDLRYTRQPLAGRMSVILGDVPRDMEAIVQYATANNRGDEALRKDATALMEQSKATVFKFQEAQTALTSGESRVVKAPGTGRTHNLHMTRPDVVADEVRWVMAGVWKIEE